VMMMMVMVTMVVVVVGLARFRTCWIKENTSSENQLVADSNLANQLNLCNDE
jgi:hypothetical protein